MYVYKRTGETSYIHTYTYICTHIYVWICVLLFSRHQTYVHTYMYIHTCVCLTCFFIFSIEKNLFFIFIFYLCLICFFIFSIEQLKPKLSVISNTKTVTMISISWCAVPSVVHKRYFRKFTSQLFIWLCLYMKI